MNLKIMISRSLMLLLLTVASMEQSAFAQVIPSGCQTNYMNPSDALRGDLGSHTISTSQVAGRGGEWILIGGWKQKNNVHLAGPNCTALGLFNQLRITGNSNIIRYFPNDPNMPIYRFTSSGSSTVGFVLQYKTPMDGGNWQNLKTSAEQKTYGHSDQNLDIDFRYQLAVLVPTVAVTQTLITGGTTPAASLLNPLTMNLSGTPNQLYPLQINVGTVVFQIPTCGFAPNTLNQLVDLREFPLSDFTGVGYETPARNFELKTDNCNTVAARDGFTIQFTSDGVVLDPSYFPTSISQLGLKLVALDSSLGTKDIKPGDKVGFSAAEPTTVYRFQAYLHQLQNSVPAGRVNSAVKLTITYR